MKCHSQCSSFVSHLNRKEALEDEEKADKFERDPNKWPVRRVCTTDLISSWKQQQMTPSFLPVNQRIVVGAIVLDLVHPYSGDVPLEVELDQCRGGRGLHHHHFLLLAGLGVPQGQASRLRSCFGHGGDVRRARVGLPLCHSVICEMREFGDGQVHRLLGLARRVGGHASEFAWNT